MYHISLKDLVNKSQHSISLQCTCHFPNTSNIITWFNIVFCNSMPQDEEWISICLFILHLVILNYTALRDPDNWVHLQIHHQVLVVTGKQTQQPSIYYIALEHNSHYQVAEFISTRASIHQVDGCLTARSWEDSKQGYSGLDFSNHSEFHRHPSSSAADMPVNFQSDAIIITSNLVALRLYTIWR